MLKKRGFDKKAQVKPQLRAITKYVVIAFVALILIYIITKIILPLMDIM